MTARLIRCRRCGCDVWWTWADLVDARERLDDGLHAAPACDDDCAAELPPWPRPALDRLIAAPSPETPQQAYARVWGRS